MLTLLHLLLLLFISSTLFNSLQGAEEEYDPQFHNAEKAIEDAEAIHNKGQGRWGTDEKGIFKIVCAAP